tara:strand:- start:1115 stop:2728 length:1614 start_codon:yes stop_codon:yes gene_type:complete
MADFETRIDDLTGFGSDTDRNAIDDWLTSGARTVLNVLPLNKLLRIADKDDFTSSIDVEGKKIISVLRIDAGNNDYRMPCRELPPSMMGKVEDANYMEKATASDPAYIIFNNELNTFPASASANDSRLISINTSITVAYNASSISDFPDEAEEAVVLYASRNALERLMNDLHTNDLIDHASTGALALMNAEIDDVVHDSTGSLAKAKAQIDAFVTSIGDIDDTTELFDNTNKRFTVVRDALVKAQDIIDNDGFGSGLDVTDFVGDVDTALGKIDAHLVDEEAILTNDPTSGDIATALTAIKTAVNQAAAAAGKFTSADESVFGDEDTFLTDASQLTRVKAALDQAENVINNNQPDANTDAFGAQAAEDTELVASALSIVQTEIQRARTHLAEWTSIGDMRVKEVQVALNEADGYAKEVQARLGYAAAYIAAANARTQEGSSRIGQANLGLAVAQQELQRANVAIAEVNSLIASYQLELQSVAPYMSEVSGKLAAAAQYGQEFQARLTRDQARYQWYTQQYAQIDARYKEQIQTLQGV